MAPTDSHIPANFISPFSVQSRSSEGHRSQSQVMSSLGSHIPKEVLQRDPLMDQDLENLLFQSNIGGLTGQRTEGCVSMELDGMDGIPPVEAVWAKERELQECLTEVEREGEGDEKEVKGVVPPLLFLPSRVSTGGNSLNAHGTGNGNRNGNGHGNGYDDRDGSVMLSNGTAISPSSPLPLPHFPPFPTNERSSSPSPIGAVQENGVNLPPTPLTFQQMQLAALQQGRDFLNMVTGCPPGLQESLWEKMKQQAYLQLLQRQANFEVTGNGSSPMMQVGLNGNIVQMTGKDVSTGMNSAFPSSSPCASQPPLTFVHNYFPPSLPAQSVAISGHSQYFIANSNSMTGISGMVDGATLPTTESGNIGVHASGLSSSSSSGRADDAQETNCNAGNKREIIYSTESQNCRRGRSGESGEGRGGMLGDHNLGSLANALQKLTQQCQEILMPHCRVGGWEEKVLELS